MIARATQLLSRCLLLWALTYGTAWCASTVSPVTPILSHEFLRTPQGAEAGTAFGDEYWWDGFGSPTTDGYVFTATEFQGSLVIAGQFSRIGDVQANSIARWDGSRWTPLGAGIKAGQVLTLIVDHGDLVAGGSFWTAGGSEAKSIARWDGSDWSAIGSGFQDEMARPATVFALESYDDTLVAAVETPQGDHLLPSRSGVSRWNGSEWLPLGPSANGRVSSLAVLDKQLFVGGSFDSIGGVPAACVARWDGSRWSAMGGGVGLSWGPANVFALSVHSGQLFAGGSFNSADGSPVGNVAIWGGTAWQPAGSGLLNGVSTFATQRDTLFAGGGNAIARWNGQDWDFPAPPLAGTPGGLVPIGDDLIAVGSIVAFNPGEDHPAALSVARLSAGRWQAINSLTGRMHGVVGYGGEGTDILSMVAYRGHIVAAGSFRYAGAPPDWIDVRDLAEWDGSRWSQFPLPPRVSQIVDLLAQGDTLYASGSFQPQPSGDSSYSYTSVYRFDGEQWAPLGAGPPSYVLAMTLYQGDLYVAEAQFSPNPETHIRRWTGVGWDLIGTALGSTFPIVMALVEHEGKLIAAGRFLTMNGVPAADIAEWDGLAWRQSGPGFPTPSTYYSEAIVRDLSVVGGQLFAAGEAVAMKPPYRMPVASS